MISICKNIFRVFQNDRSCVSSLYTIRDENAPAPWPTRTIKDTHKITARIGPTGGLRGYVAITGIESWGISWFLNDLLIPELYVKRGETYTFIVEGGMEPDQPARYHPFYITDSPLGGIGQSDNKPRTETTYAGVKFNEEGYPTPLAAGRYCEWEHKTIDKSKESVTYEDFMKTITLVCEEGPPAILNWTVPLNAPDTLYYQVLLLHRLEN